MGTKTKTTEKSNNTQTVAPPSWTMPGIQAASDKVIGALNGPQVPAYTGNFVAGANYAPAIDAYTGAADKAGQFGDWVTGAAKDWAPTTANFGMQLPTLSAWSNPNTDATMGGAISAKARGVTDQFLQQTLPGLRSSALEAGAYSGDRASAILPQMALDDATKNISDIAAGYVYENAQANANRDLSAWQTGEANKINLFGADTSRGLGTAELAGNQQLQFLQQLPELVDTAMRMQTSRGDILTQTADLDRSQRQQGIDNGLAQHDYAVRAPFEGLDLATQLLASLSGNYGTTTQAGDRTTTQQVSGMGPIVQGLMGAASLAAGFPMGGGGTLASKLFGGAAKGASLGPVTPVDVFRNPVTLGG